MNDSEKLLGELKEIREIMDKSTRFLSLSGLSGILVGIYALVGAFAGWKLLYQDFSTAIRDHSANRLTLYLALICLVILAISLLTVVLLTWRKALGEGKSIWGKSSKLLLINLAIPLLTGGFLVIILVYRGVYEIIAPSFLIFYGLALVNASKHTRHEIQTLGILEIILGLLAALLPGYGIYFWAVGFGILHIIYGSLYLAEEKKMKLRTP